MQTIAIAVFVEVSQVDVGMSTTMSSVHTIGGRNNICEFLRLNSIEELGLWLIIGQIICMLSAESM